MQARPAAVRAGGLVFFVLLERVQAMRLEHAFGFVRKQHGVAVERDTHFIRIVGAGQHRFGQHARGWKSGGECFAHIVCVGG